MLQAQKAKPTQIIGNISTIRLKPRSGAQLNMPLQASCAADVQAPHPRARDARRDGVHLREMAASRVSAATQCDRGGERLGGIWNAEGTAVYQLLAFCHTTNHHFPRHRRTKCADARLLQNSTRRRHVNAARGSNRAPLSRAGSQRQARIVDDKARPQLE